MPTIAQQLRAERRRRDRLRQSVAGLVVLAFGGFVATRILSGTEAQLAGATAAGLVTTATAPTTTTTVATDLRPGLVAAFDRAQAAAAEAGHRLTITSGFRTADEQEALLQAETVKRGSLAEALWWVFPPEQSMHVHGLAVDVGDGPAADWLEVHGARFGLCRTLDWEWWHFEWRERWETSGTCPRPAETPDDAPQP